MGAVTGAGLNVVNWIFTGLAIVVVGARMFTRIVVVKQIGIDDALMFIALLCAIVMSCLLSVAVHDGLGGHEVFMGASEFSYLAGMLAILCQIFGRVSWAWTLLILMGTTARRRYLLYFLMITQVLVNVVLLALSYGMCRPIQVFWNPSIAGSQACLALYHRVVINGWQWFQTAWDAITDLILAFFPVSVLSSLQISKSLKVGLSILMSLGVFSGALTVLKAVEYYDVFRHPEISSYTQANIFVWMILHADIVVIAASIPSCRPLFRSGKFEGRHEGGLYELGPFGRRHAAMRLGKQKPKQTSYSPQGSKGLEKESYSGDRPTIGKSIHTVYGSQTNPPAPSLPESEDYILPKQAQDMV